MACLSSVGAPCTDGHQPLCHVTSSPKPRHVVNDRRTTKKVVLPPHRPPSAPLSCHITPHPKPHVNRQITKSVLRPAGLNSLPKWLRSAPHLSEGELARVKLAMLLQPDRVRRCRGCIIDGLGAGIQARGSAPRGRGPALDGRAQTVMVWSH